MGVPRWWQVSPGEAEARRREGEERRRQRAALAYARAEHCTCRSPVPARMYLGRVACGVCRKFILETGGSS